MGYYSCNYSGSFERIVKCLLNDMGVKPEKIVTRGGSHVWTLVKTGNTYRASVFMCVKDKDNNCYYNEVPVSFGPTVDDMPKSWCKLLDYSDGYTGSYCKRIKGEKHGNV